MLISNVKLETVNHFQAENSNENFKKGGIIMKNLTSLVLLIVVGSLLFAAPSLDVQKPPVIPNPSWTGPLVDPHAVQGQWFKRISDNMEEPRSHEFYDNVEGFGGGFMSCLAIEGYVVNIIYAGGPGTNILAFDVDARITNDTPAWTPWADGSNSHGEYLSTIDQFEGELLDVKMCAEFALNQFMMVPTIWTPPYYNITPYIVAQNEDQEAWYCWTPDNPQNLTPYGDYFVPTWDFGNIPPGLTANRLQQFICTGGGIPPGDPRYTPLVNSFEEGEDIYMNRTTSLKISHWLEYIYTDTCVPYPEDGHGSDVSVFHNIEEGPTPVELSSFTAFYSNGAASLNWTTQSESNNQGWNVYRSETEIFSDAVQINSGLIEGAGTTSNPTDYNFTDEYYLEVNATYNYWLESKDESGAIETFGPIPLTIPENNGETPEPPNTDSGLLKLNNYPNPFYPDTEISFMLQEEGPVELSIFNVKGQKIATLFDGYVSENNLDQVQRVNWNGRDDSGKELTSGLYFYRINTSKGSFTNKMLLSR